MRALAFVLALTFATAAHAETRRLAVVVGNNAGNPGRRPLRFAESDASKLARVLVDLGGVASDDLVLLQGAGVEQVTRALELATARVAEWHRAPDARVVLVFYFSGHSDGAALELGPGRLPYAELRRALAATGAEVKLAIVDACQSGALLTTKGATAGAGFAVSLSDDLDARGSVFLTSSAGSEYALESAEIQGSYFTHHLVSGLRGAADASGDGRVTLAEAYRYAFDRTVAATAATAVGPQHPNYDYALSGQGELVLTELRDRPVAALVFPGGLERALVVDLAHDQVVAELGPLAPPRIDLAPGSYGVRVWRSAQALGERVDLAAGEERRVQWDELRPVSGALVAAKGGDASAEVVMQPGLEAQRAESVFAASAEVGLLHGLAAASMPGFRVAFENAHAIGFGVSATVATRSGQETDFDLRLSLRLGGDVGRARLLLALEGGPGVIDVPGDKPWGPELVVGPKVGARFFVTSKLAIALDAEAPLAVGYYAGGVHAGLAPAVLAGVQLGL